LLDSCLFLHIEVIEMLRHVPLIATLTLWPLFTLVGLANGPAPTDPQAPPHKKTDVEPKSRSFLFTYRATVTSLPAGKVARIWIPVPPSNEDQEIQLLSKKLPAACDISPEPKFGNQILYLEAGAGADGKIHLQVTYRVTRHEVKSNLKSPSHQPLQLARYLEPNSKVPVDGKPLDLIKGKVLPKDQVAAARVLYDLVNNHMRYSKQGTGWGRGDSIWACESGYGNCSDFHSLFISLARSQKIPAKFEIGFPLPVERGAGEVPGYHCWAKFHPQSNGWIPVDISEANKNPAMKDYYFGNLTEDRLTFSSGRDVDLVPKQQGPPLNFFVYPYVEVDGKPYGTDQMMKAFSYEDLPAGPKN
jgi:transglutaminase-like putative cysteine protease